MRLDSHLPARPHTTAPLLGRVPPPLFLGTALAAVLTVSPGLAGAAEDWTYEQLMQQLDSGAVSTVHFWHDGRSAMVDDTAGESHYAQLFPTDTTARQLLYPPVAVSTSLTQSMEEELVKRLSAQSVEFDVMPKPDRWAPLKSYLQVFPLLLGIWTSVFVYFQWRFRMAGEGGDRLADIKAARRQAAWLEASRIPTFGQGAEDIEEDH